jgi:hypothetical protein
MLWDASAINGYAIEASDGQLGTVSDLLFDDFGWIIRWLVVDTGHWLPGRKVLLPLSALGQPDRALRHFPVKLTMQQVKDSPDIDTDQPVSRQIESDLYGYYGWGPYWGSNTFLSNAMATPFVPPLYQSESKPLEPGSVDARPNQGDPHLRSISAIAGYHIHATDGMIGHVEDLLVDVAGWHIRYLTVDTRNWWPGKKVLISPFTVREIDWAERLIHLNVNRQKVKDGPEYDPTITVDGAYNDKFLTYYGIRWVEGTRRET